MRYRMCGMNNSNRTHENCVKAFQSGHSKDEVQTLARRRAEITHEQIRPVRCAEQTSLLRPLSKYCHQPALLYV